MVVISIQQMLILSLKANVEQRIVGINEYTGISYSFVSIRRKYSQIQHLVEFYDHDMCCISSQWECFSIPKPVRSLKK